MDRLKPVISSVPVVPGVPPVRGWPRLKPASIPGPTVQDRPQVKKVTFSPVKKVRFSLVPAPPEPSPDSSKFFASLCCPPSSPSRGSNCGYRQLDDNLQYCLFFISTFCRVSIIPSKKIPAELYFSRISHTEFRTNSVGKIQWNSAEIFRRNKIPRNLVATLFLNFAS